MFALQVAGFLGKFFVIRKRDDNPAQQYPPRHPSPRALLNSDDDTIDDGETNGSLAHMDPEADEDYIPTNLKLVIVLSGKRKTGKDHISTMIMNYIGHARLHDVAILRLAAPIKEQFSKSSKLDFTRLLDSSEYKQNLRRAMNDFTEDFREKQGWNCFLKKAIKDQRAKHKLIWIVSEARQVCDLEYFESDPAFSGVKLIKLRIDSCVPARMSRGWEYEPIVDDRASECDLDDYDDWTYVINNDSNDNRDLLLEDFRPIFYEIDMALAGL